MGPVVIATFGYTYPDNVATNTQADAYLGYTLLWAELWDDVMVLLIKKLTAKLGIATGKIWGSISAMAAGGDHCNGYPLAEFFVATIGLKLLGGRS